MTIKFTDSSLAELAENKTLLGKQKFPEEVIKAFKKRIFQIRNANSTQDLRNNKSLHYKKLKEKRYAGKYSIRLNKAYRVIFGVDKQGSLEIILIEEISNHYT
jgi:proteic killer suppression protein